MRKHFGFVALGLFFVGAAVYGFLPQADVARIPDISGQTTAQTVPSAPSPTPRRADETPPEGDFDFYVLALSWSPTFCQDNGAGRNREQCGADRQFGWVVHGLWPQFERGYPESCDTNQPRQVPEGVGRLVMDIMPGMGLIGHQWRKHGTCSGLAMRDYFGLVRDAFERVQLPAEFDSVTRETRTSPAALEEAFIRNNPGLSRSAVAVTCDKDRLDEIRICFSTSLTFRPCPEVDGRSCRRSEITIPPMR